MARSKRSPETLGEQIEKLTQAVEQLAGQVNIFWNILNEARAEFACALEHKLFGGASADSDAPQGSLETADTAEHSAGGPVAMNAGEGTPEASARGEDRDAGVQKDLF